MMKQIFIDTDMGSDCDDVAAVAILAHFHKLGKINLLGVSHTSANPRAVEYLDMVCRFYGYKPSVLLSFILYCVKLPNQQKKVQPFLSQHVCLRSDARDRFEYGRMCKARRLIQRMRYALHRKGCLHIF